MKLRYLPVIFAAITASQAHAWTTKSLTITGETFTMFQADTGNGFGRRRGPAGLLQYAE